jgi:hypothetical protein
MELVFKWTRTIYDSVKQESYHIRAATKRPVTITPSLASDIDYACRLSQYNAHTYHVSLQDIGVRARSWSGEEIACTYENHLGYCRVQMRTTFLSDPLSREELVRVRRSVPFAQRKRNKIFALDIRR